MLHLFGGEVVCSPNVIISNVFAPACQERLIFPMNFHDSCLSPISLILHRCSRAMNSMALRTSRFCMAHNVSYFQYILKILLFAHVRCFKMLLLACVLATFSKFIKTREHRKHTLFSCCMFMHIFPTIFIDFMLSQFDAALAKLQNIQRTCCHMSRLRPLMSTKPHCA